jgi:hypothetical protein
MDRQSAKTALSVIGNEIAAIDAEMANLVDLLTNNKITPTLAAVREINLKARRQALADNFKSISALPCCNI